MNHTEMKKDCLKSLMIKYSNHLQKLMTSQKVQAGLFATLSGYSLHLVGAGLAQQTLRPENQDEHQQ
jgi:hypothetical protein